MGAWGQAWRGTSLQTGVEEQVLQMEANTGYAPWLDLFFMELSWEHPFQSERQSHKATGAQSTVTEPPASQCRTPERRDTGAAGHRSGGPNTQFAETFNI